MNKSIVLIMLFFFSMSIMTFSQNNNPDPKEILKKAEDKLNGVTAQSEMKMTIVRPTWTREMQMKSWGLGAEFGLILITAPARDKGAAFLKREKEIWNWQPTIDRVIKLPPSMMMQSWMGSDFTNDDLVQQSDMIEDFKHTIIGSEEIEERDCYIIELIPNEEAAVVWGKMILWIDKKEYMQLKVQFFDEDDYLVNTLYGKNIKELGGKLLPSVLEVIPEEEEGHKTIVEYLWMKFDEPIKDQFFSVQNMKRVR